MKPVSVGILGCGAIAPAYLGHLCRTFSGLVDVRACADVVHDAAVARAREFGVARSCSPEELLADPAVELVVNLTPAPAHHAASRRILDAGRHLFSEKPLALGREHARELLELAARRGLRVGGAADTFLGASLQLCRRFVDEGRIGTPVAATALTTVGMFDSVRYHQVYRGALLDLGPYYLTALVALLGPVKRVCGAAEIRFAQKPHPAGSPDEGKSFAVDIPSSAAAALEFADGTVASLVATCDTPLYSPRVEIFGTRGRLQLNDANDYGGRVVLHTAEGEQAFDSAPGFGGKGRGLGVVEMALALREGRAPRSDGALMYHVLDVLLAVHDSSAAAAHATIASRVGRPEPFEFETAVRG